MMKYNTSRLVISKLINKCRFSTSKGDEPNNCNTLYDCRKYGHCLPINSVCPPFETLNNIPTGIFRYSYGEFLGPCADKCQMYKNPEYYSFHHMTYFDMHYLMKGMRQQRKDPKRKTIICIEKSKEPKKN